MRHINTARNQNSKLHIAVTDGILVLHLVASSSGVLFRIRSRHLARTLAGDGEAIGMMQGSPSWEIADVDKSRKGPQ